MSPKKLALSALILSTSLAAHAYEKDKTYHFTVLHSNDTTDVSGKTIVANTAFPC